VLAAVAVFAPTPWWTDRGFYEELGRRVLIRDCTDVHCFRPLVPAILEHLPGPSLVKWKAYAVIANTAAAVAVGRLCVLAGLSASASLAAMWLSAVGTGSLYSIFDCYTPDPLMYMLGPITALALWRSRVGRAGWIAALGVLAKEFAAAPLWIFTLAAVLRRRWRTAAQLCLASVAVMAVWLAKQAGLMAMMNYRLGSNTSADVLHGGYLRFWISQTGPTGALAFLFTTFAATYVLLPVGFARSGPSMRALAIASVPAAAAFVYVEQPERALWNFHFIVIPVGVAALEELPGWALALFVAVSGVVGLRFGAQFHIRSPARAALVIAIGLALVASYMSIRRRGGTQISETPPVDPASLAQTRFWTAAIANVAAVALSVLVMIDVHAHRRDEASYGVNQWGFRGPLQSAAHPGLRIAWLGGAAAFDGRTSWPGTLPSQLAAAINERAGWTQAGGAAAGGAGATFASVDNFAEPAAGPDSYVATLRDYAYLHPDVVCIYGGDSGLNGENPPGRRQSIVFRTTGYLPVRAALQIEPAPPEGEDAIAAVLAAVRFALQRGQSVVVAVPPDVSVRREAQQRSLVEQLTREFGRDARVRYVDLGRAFERQEQAARIAASILDVAHLPNVSAAARTSPQPPNDARRPR